MIVVDQILKGYLTLELAPSEDTYLQVSNSNSSCVLSANILSTGGTFIVKSTIDSIDLFKEVSITDSDINWEFIKIDGISYTEVDSSFASLEFLAPNILYLKNSSSGSQIIRFSLRGNKA